MNRLFTFLLAVALTASVWAQSPQKMSYQAVIRNSSNDLVTSTIVGMRISILQGSATGSTVYTETQAPTTNANGLVSIEIGGGTGFNSINWADGTYFIKTETDPTGGSIYTITCTSQLLTVPYAFYAKTAGSYTETDPIFNASVAKNIKASDTTKWSNKLSSYAETDPIFNSSVAKNIKVSDTTKWSNKLGSFTETDPIYNASVSKSIKASDTVKWNNKLSSYTETDPIFNASVAKKITAADTAKWTAAIHKLGDSYGGGIVFYIDATGQHGLIAATTDLSTGIQWYNGTNTTTYAVRNGIVAGMYNTERIVTNQGAGSYAAQLCANYQGGNYGDWYLPSKYELNLLYLQKAVVGGLAGNYYWSSTEYSSNDYAWYQNFSNGGQSGDSKSISYCIRAIRAF
jgi:hypothetical protein